MGATELECRTGQCRIPPLRPEAQRILAIRDLIASLRNLVDPGTVCRIYHVDSRDLLLLAAVEDELKRCRTIDETP